MRTWREQFAKSFLEDVLGPLGTVEAQHEIAHPEAQWADVWFEPDPDQSDEGLRLGWLGKPSLANLWVLAPSLRSSHALDFGLNAREGWPCGFYFSVPGYGLGWVSLRELPPGRETLLLRLLSAGGAVFLGALRNYPVTRREPAKAREADGAVHCTVTEADRRFGGRSRVTG